MIDNRWIYFQSNNGIKIYENIKICVFACCMQLSHYFVNKVVLLSWSGNTQETTKDCVKDEDNIE